MKFSPIYIYSISKGQISTLLYSLYSIYIYIYTDWHIYIGNSREVIS